MCHSVYFACLCGIHIEYTDAAAEPVLSAESAGRLQSRIHKYTSKQRLDNQLHELVNVSDCTLIIAIKTQLRLGEGLVAKD